MKAVSGMGTCWGLGETEMGRVGVEMIKILCTYE